jgi:hypothetical protein
MSEAPSPASHNEAPDPIEPDAPKRAVKTAQVDDVSLKPRWLWAVFLVLAIGIPIVAWWIERAH